MRNVSGKVPLHLRVGRVERAHRLRIPVYLQHKPHGDGDNGPRARVSSTPKASGPLLRPDAPLSEGQEARLFGGDEHGPNVAVVLVRDRREAFDKAVGERVPGGRVLAHGHQRGFDVRLECVWQPARGHDGLYPRWTQSIYHPHLRPEFRMVAQFDGQHLGVDGRRVYLPRTDHADRPLVRTRLDHPPEEAARLAHAHQPVTGNVVARVRVRVVEGPRAIPQVREGAVGAVFVDYDVGEVDGSAPVPFAAQHWRGQQLDRRRGFACEVHVGKAADKADVDLSGGELAEGGPDGQLGPHPER